MNVSNKPFSIPISRRDLFKYSCIAGTSLMFGLYKGGTAMSNTQASRVSLVRTTTGVAGSIDALQTNPVKGKEVLVKPNFNTADAFPGSTHNDTLAALVQKLWAMGAASIRLGERSYSPTQRVMQDKGIFALMEDLGVQILNFDDLPEKDWVKVDAPDSHWRDGFRVALDASAVAVLKHLGSNESIMKPKVYAQEQIARAAELGLGAQSASAIEMVPGDRESHEFCRQVDEILQKG